MTKLSANDQKRQRRFERLSLPALERLGIVQTYNMRTFWVDRIDAGPQGTPSNNSALMSIETNYPYRDIDISIARKQFDSTSPKRLEYAIIHEAMHAILYGWVHKCFEDKEYKRSNAEIYAEEDVVSLVAGWLQRAVEK